MYGINWFTVVSCLTNKYHQGKYTVGEYVISYTLHSKHTVLTEQVTEAAS